MSRYPDEVFATWPRDWPPGWPSDWLQEPSFYAWPGQERTEDDSPGGASPPCSLAHYG